LPYLIYSDIIGPLKYIVKVMKRTYQPKKIKRIRKFGFRARRKTVGGRRVLKNRRRKGRTQLSASEEFRLLRKLPKKTQR